MKPECPFAHVLLKLLLENIRKKFVIEHQGKSQVTILACGSATGHVIPLFIIYTEKQITPLWTQDEVTES